MKLIRQGKILLRIALVSITLGIIPTLLYGQINFTGRIKNITGANTGLSMNSEESGMTIQIKNKNGKTHVVSESHVYTISEKKGFVLTDSTGKEILKTDKKNKFYYTSSGDTLYSKSCKGWNICLADRLGNVAVKGKYTLTGNDSQIIIEAVGSDISIIALIGYRLIKQSKSLAETNEWLLILSTL
jgi:hypothetical protein